LIDKKGHVARRRLKHGETFIAFNYHIVFSTMGKS